MKNNIHNINIDARISSVTYEPNDGEEGIDKVNSGELIINKNDNVIEVDFNSLLLVTREEKLKLERQKLIQESMLRHPSNYGSPASSSTSSTSST